MSKFFSEAQIMAAERQILELQKTVDYFITEYTIEELLQKYQTGQSQNENEIFISPVSDKKVWNPKKQILFLESLLLGLPMSYLVLAPSEQQPHRMEVVDGGERLKTLDAFVHQELMLHDLKKLTLLNGFRFKDLPWSRQRGFKKRIVRCVLLADKTDLETRHFLTF